MRQFVRKIFGFICALMVALPLWAQHFPELTGYVVDEAGILSDSDRYEMTQRLQALRPRQVVVATVNSLDGYSIDEYANMLFRHWGLGDKNRNDGVLILFAPNERFVRIEVGYGLEDVLTDALSGQIVYKKIIPLAKQNKFPKALKAGVDAVADILSGVMPDFSQHTGDTPVYLFLASLLLFFCSFLIGGLSGFRYIRRNSTPNRIFFFLWIFCFSAVYFPFLMLIFFVPIPIGLIFFCFILLHHYGFVGHSAIHAWKKDPLFPFNQLWAGRGDGYFSHGSSGGFGHGGGGGGFGGGGGSSGGGGASGGF